MFSSWLRASKVYFDRRMLVMLLLGFSSGFPSSIFGSTLVWWLQSLGVSEKRIGLFSLVKAPYSFKWLWSPIVDRVKLPFLHKLGRRRSWAVFSQAMLLITIFLVSQVNPVFSLKVLAIIMVFVVIASATQDIVLDAYRIEMFEPKEQGAGTATFILGYRIGMIFSGAGALFLVSKVGWSGVYMILAFASLVGMITILFSRETSSEIVEIEQGKSRLERIKIFLQKTVVDSVKSFMENKYWKAILLFVFLYRMSDAYLGTMAYVFYGQLGFNEIEIATVSKLYGVVATILGGIVGGVVVSRFSIYKALLIGGILQGLSNLMFIYQASRGYDIWALTLTISVENITGGIAIAVFVAYMSSLCNSLYTATQYAILSSLVMFVRDVVASSSGYLVAAVSWNMFFIITSLMTIPGLLVLWYLSKVSKNE